MDALDRAKSAAESRIAEIGDNLSIRQGYATFIVGNSSAIFANASPAVRAELSKLLKFKSADPVVVYRGLMTQLNGTFELFVKQLSAAVLQHYADQTSRYSELSPALREAHAVSSAIVLSKLSDGQINGMNYDFGRLQASLGACFSDTQPYRLNTDALTIYIGNCLPDRIDQLFKKLSLGEAFSDDLGRSRLVKEWSKITGARAATKLAKIELIRQIEIRNDIVHSGGASRDITPLEVEEACTFFRAIISALAEKARVKIGAAA